MHPTHIQPASNGLVPLLQSQGRTSHMHMFRSSRVSNPFKQQRSVVLHYLTIVFVAGSLTLLVILRKFPADYERSGTITVAIDTQHHTIQGSLNEEAEHADDESDYGDSSEGDDVIRPISQIEFPSWIHKYYQDLQWTEFHGFEGNREGPMLTREVLLESLRLGCTNIAENQNLAGNFNYQYDFVARVLDTQDNDVRQGGALWGISLCYQYDPSNLQYKAAVEKGLQFFMDHSVKGFTDDMILVRYPDDEAKKSTTGTNALFGLAMIEYLRTVETTKGDTASSEIVSQVRIVLRKLIAHLLYMQRPDKHFSVGFSFELDQKVNSSSPYFDGEVMLCLTKAAKYIDGFTELVTIIEATAFVLAKAYSIDAWVEESDQDSDSTKGFYQWGSMFLTEYYQSRWANFELAGDFVVALGHWILEVHHVLQRNRNTGYAFEGIISAYDIAKTRNLADVLPYFERAIDRGLYKLTTWQVGGPLAKENEFLQNHPTDEGIAIGGIMNAKNLSPLRIDTTQHQMHALIMALDSVYTQSE